MSGISVVMPIKIEHEWQIDMTTCAISTLRCTTEFPFQLVVVEHQTRIFDMQCDVHIVANGPSPNAELNQGVEAADGDIIVYTGNDIFVRPGWVEALLQCFECRDDCGLATLMTSDLNHVKQVAQRSGICEGIYGPFMAFRKGWTFDADSFPCQFGDSDLIARHYIAGQRMLRNHDVTIHHLNRQTLSSDDNNQDFALARKRFLEKYQSQPLFVVRMLCEGWII